MTAKQPVNPIAASWTWGSSAVVRADAASPAVGFITNALTSQLAQVSLPEPAVCSLYLQAKVRSNFPLLDNVQLLTVNMFQGIGRVTVPRELTFQNQPAVNAPLELTLPFVPLHALNVDVSAVFFMSSGQATRQVELEIYLVLSTITRIREKEQKLAFGMALPGEADSMDDEMVAELEAEGPSVQQTMLDDAAEQQAAAVEGEQDDDDDDGPELVQQAPAWLLDLVEALRQRLGRQPTRDELREVIARRQGRRRRRLARLPR